MGAADSHGPLPRGESDRNPYTQGYLDGFAQGRRHRDALGEVGRLGPNQHGTIAPPGPNQHGTIAPPGAFGPGDPSQGGSVQHMPEPGQGSAIKLPEPEALYETPDDVVYPAGPAGEVRTRSETGGEKGDKLARFDLIPAGPLWLLAELYGKGARKYDARNWERGYPWHLSYAAAMRHMTLFWQGEDVDPEMGLPHPVCAVFHMFALVEFMATQPGYDDRPTRRAAAETSEDARPRHPGRDGS